MKVLYSGYTSYLCDATAPVYCISAEYEGFYSVCVYT